MLLRRRQQKLQIEPWKKTRKRNQKGDNVTKESRKREDETIEDKTDIYGSK